MLVKPKQAYESMGTSIRLDPTLVYLAIPAINQPDYRKRKAVFVLCDGAGDPAGDPEESVGLLLEDGEYERVEDEA
jgi:hypothetical protein